MPRDECGRMEIAMWIRDARVYRDGKFEQGDIRIDGERFGSETGTSGAEQAGSGDQSVQEINAEGLYAIPGLIDIHFHGCVGHELGEATYEAFEAMAKYQQSVGVLAICPATMTCSEEEMCRTAKAAAEYEGSGADLVGLHLEGPFLSPNKVGAQNPDYLQLPKAETVLRWQELSGGLIRQCDVAPELPGAMEFIGEISRVLPAVSIAHTTADYDTARAALTAGANHLTHGFNAMPGIHHREPGPLIAASEAGADVELIADNVHLHPAIIRAAFKLFGEDHVVFISDSMAACGLKDGDYSLGGLKVTVKGRRAVLTDHPETLAGSVTNLMDCVRRAVNEMGIPLELAVKASTINPARSIGIDRDYGEIAEGKFANVLLLDENLQLCHIIQKGVLIR